MCSSDLVTHSIFESAFLSTRILVMSRAHGAPVAEISVDPQARRDDDYRMSETFTQISRRAPAWLQ